MGPAVHPGAPGPSANGRGVSGPGVNSPGLNGAGMNGAGIHGAGMNGFAAGAPAMNVPGSSGGGSGTGSNGPESLPPVARRYSDSYTPTGYIPRSPGPQDYAPRSRGPYGPTETSAGNGVAGSSPNGPAGLGGAPVAASPLGLASAPPRDNVRSRPPAAPPLRSAPENPPARNLPPATPLGNAVVNGHDSPGTRRAFTPVQDYFSGPESERPRRIESRAYEPDRHAQEPSPRPAQRRAPDVRETSEQYSRDESLNMPLSPLPLGNEYSARALAELARAMEHSAQDSREERELRDHEANDFGANDFGANDGVTTYGDESRSWDGDTITPERLENLLARSEPDEPLTGDDTLMNKNPINPRSPRVALEPERVPHPARPSRRSRHPLVVIGNTIFMLLIIIGVVVGGGVLFGKQRFEAPGPLDDDKMVTIPKGLGIRDISDLLVQEGVIDQPWIFMGGVFVLKARDGLKAGEYQFTKHASLHDVVSTIVEGRVVQHQLTMAEGLTSEQIVERLLQNDVLTGNIREIPREGSLLPESYKFVRGTTREQLIQRMQQAQQRVLQEIWDHRAPDLPLKTPEQLVTLASIVEKETGKPEERSRVAAVFVNRLKQKMRLQSDPTIIYGLVGGKGSLGRPIMRSEIEQPTPYNTYVIDGLPPGPIANPGRATLEATANPARTKEIFFVASGDGGHAFAETLEQHQKNVAHLRELEQQQHSSSPWPTTFPTPASPEPAAPAAPAKPKPRAGIIKPLAAQ
jgi:UPF0755 protein